MPRITELKIPVLSQNSLSEKTLNMSLMYYDLLAAKFIVADCVSDKLTLFLAIVSLLVRVRVTLRATSSSNPFSPYS